MNATFQRIYDTHPTIQMIRPDHHSAPTMCRRCNDVIDVAAHTLDDCEASQQHQAKNEAFAKMLQREMSGVT